MRPRAQTTQAPTGRHAGSGALSPGGRKSAGHRHSGVPRAKEPGQVKHPCRGELRRFDKAWLRPVCGVPPAQAGDSVEDCAAALAEAHEAAEGVRGRARTARLGGVNHEVVEARRQVCELVWRTRAAAQAVRACAAEPGRKRWGAWSLREICAAIARGADFRRRHLLSDAQWAKHIASQVQATLGRWHAVAAAAPGCEARLAALAQVVAAQLERVRRHRAAAKVQAVVRSWLSRALPRFVLQRCGAARVVQWGRELHWQALGEVNVRTLMARGSSQLREGGAGAAAVVREDKWSRMRRVAVAVAAGGLVLFDGEDGFGARSLDDVLRLGFCLRLFPLEESMFETRLRERRALAAPPKAGPGSPGSVGASSPPGSAAGRSPSSAAASPPRSLDGFELDPCVVDDSALKTALKFAERQHVSAKLQAERRESKAWLYACSDTAASVADIARVRNFLERIVAHGRLPTSFARQMQAAVAARWAQRAYAAREAPRERALLARVRELEAKLAETRVSVKTARRALEHFRAELVDMRPLTAPAEQHSRPPSATPGTPGGGTGGGGAPRASHVLPGGAVGAGVAAAAARPAAAAAAATSTTGAATLAGATPNEVSVSVSVSREQAAATALAERVFARVERSHKKAAGTRYGLPPGGQALQTVRVGSRVLAEAGKAGALRLARNLVMTQAKALGRLQSLAALVLGRWLRGRRAAQATRARAAEERARRSRAARARAERLRQLQDRAELTARLRDLYRRLQAGRIQRAFRRSRSRRARRVAAAHTLCRFARYVLALSRARAAAQLAAVAAAHLQVAVSHFFARGARRAWDRWREYRAAHAVWRGRHDVLRHMMCARVLQRTARAFRRRKLQLAASVISGSSLHPRVAELLQAFRADRDVARLLARLRVDWAARETVRAPLALVQSNEERMLEDARRIDRDRALAELDQAGRLRWTLGPALLDNNDKAAAAAAAADDALTLVLYPFYQWPLTRESGGKRFILHQFWRVIGAVNLDYWSFTRLKRRADADQHRRREDAMRDEFRRIVVLRDTAGADPREERESSGRSASGGGAHVAQDPSQGQDQQLKVLARGKLHHHAPALPWAPPAGRYARQAEDLLLRLFLPDELCANCLALFAEPARLGACARCGTPRYQLEPKRRGPGAGRERLAANPALQLDWLILHAGLALRVERATHRRLQALWLADPQGALVRKPALEREALDAEHEVWGAAQAARHWAARLQSAGVADLPMLALQLKQGGGDRWLRDYGMPEDLADRVAAWIAHLYA
jgi:hypothetical protein